MKAHTSDRDFSGDIVPGCEVIVPSTKDVVTLKDTLLCYVHTNVFFSVCLED